MNANNTLLDCGVAFVGLMLAQILILGGTHFDYTSTVISITVISEIVLGLYFVGIVAVRAIALTYTVFTHHV
jgi:hypothetical protein